VGSGRRWGPWWSLWAVVVVVDHGGHWCWSFLGTVCERSWAVEVVVGSGHRWGPWWSLWAVVVIVDHGGHWCWSFLGAVCERSWAVEVIVGSGRRCGPWWSLWAMVVVVGRGSRSVWGRCSRWPLSSIVLHWVVCRHGWWCCSFVGGCCRDCQTTQHVVDVPRRCHLPCRVALLLMCHVIVTTSSRHGVVLIHLLGASDVDLLPHCPCGWCVPSW